MKLLCISAYPPAKDGIADYTDRYVKSLKLTHPNVEVYIISPRDSTATKLPRVYRTLGSKKKDIEDTLQVIDKIKPDVIHLQYCIALYGLNFHVLYKLMRTVGQRWPKTKRIITLHEIQREQEKLHFVAKLFYRYFLKVFDGFIVHTKTARDILKRDYNVQLKSIKKINFPLVELATNNLSKNTEAINKKYDLKDKLVVLSFGFIQIDKGIDDLVKALLILNKDSRLKEKIRIVVAGDIRSRKSIMKFFERKDRKYLKDIHGFIKKHSLEEQVVFTGYVDSAYVAAFFNRADILVIPYTSIEQSSVLSISLTARKPIIASNIGGLGETLKSTGILIPPRNHLKLAEALGNIYKSPKMTRQLIDSYRPLLVEHNQKSVDESVINFYKDCA